MQIDFHHATTYVVARLAGFSHSEAGIIGHAAQYVDDATHWGEIKFDTGAMYSRISSAHRMLDYRNFKELANARVWIPFHFLPGNNGVPPGRNRKGLYDRLVTRPNSCVAQDMIASCIKDQDQPFSLHRLGITMHVFADTWAHQGFVGVCDRINRVQNLRIVDDDGTERLDESFPHRAESFFGKLYDRARSKLLRNLLPLGHGAALSYPDKPYLHWVYENGRGQTVRRNNPVDFLTAADEMCKALKRYRRRNPNARVTGLPGPQKKLIGHMLRTLRHEEGEDRHKIWVKAIARGDFGFKARISYVGKGVGSWKAKALGTTREDFEKEHEFEFDPKFMKSDWRMFHDGLQAHRFAVLHEILPPYGISMG